MKNTISLLIVCIFSSAILYAQSVKTSFSERIALKDFIGIPQHTFFGGESVTIHAYKKKGNRYHFLVETENYATSFSCNKIPFYASEKELKKLPSAIGSKADALLRERQQAVNQRKVAKEQQARIARERAEAESTAQYRRKALDGKIKVRLKAKAAYLKNKDGETPFLYGDTVTLIGFSDHKYNCSYAIYSDKVADVFEAGFSGSQIVEYNKDVDFRKFPSCDDPEVKNILKRQSVIVDSIKAINAIKAAKEAAEERVRVEESLKQRIQEYKENSPFIISYISWSSNSVGGITVYIDITNCTQNTIKYVTFQGYFLNAVGDRCMRT